MLRKFMKWLFAPVLITLSGCSSTPPGDVAVLVEVPRPTGLTDESLDQAFLDAAPAYQDIAGLKRKYFTHSDTHFGGVYLWSSIKAAETFYNDEWQKRIVSTYGSEALLTYFDAPVVTPGGSEKSANSKSAVTIVRVSAPWYAPRGTIVGRMKDAVPLYESLAGLDFKYFTIAEGKKVGGIYLWENGEAADAFYNEDWHKRIRETYGEDADIVRLESSVQVLNE